MNEFWATRTGRWRVRLRQDPSEPVEQRLCRAIVMDIGEGLLPSGAILPTARRVAAELAIAEEKVGEAYQLLLLDGFLETHPGKGLVIAAASDDGSREIGVNTQVLFEESLLVAARRAIAEGVSVKDASGIFPRSRPPSDPEETDTDR